MAPVTNGRLLFNSVPTGMPTDAHALVFMNPLCSHILQGYPEPGKTTVYDTTETIDLETVALKGGFLIKTLELSIDPYMRERLRELTVGSSYFVSFEVVGFRINRTDDKFPIASIHTWGAVSSTRSFVIFG